MRLFRGLIAATAVSLVACSDSSAPNNNDASLRVVHATSSLNALDVLVDGELVLNGVSFGTTRLAQVPSGSHQLTFRSGQTVIGEITTTLTADHINAVFVANGTPQMASSVIPDTGAVAPTRANLRLVNVAGSNVTDPTELQVLINFPGVSADSTAKIGLDAKVARYYSLMYFDAGHFRLRYVPAGTTTVLAEAEFDIALGETKVAVLERDANGQYRVSVVVEQPPSGN